MTDPLADLDGMPDVGQYQPHPNQSVTRYRPSEQPACLICLSLGCRHQPQTEPLEEIA